jgi:hypothetical protein
MFDEALAAFQKTRAISQSLLAVWFALISGKAGVIFPERPVAWRRTRIRIEASHGENRGFESLGNANGNKYLVENSGNTSRENQTSTIHRADIQNRLSEFARGVADREFSP